MDLDPIEFGRMQAELEGLRRDNDRLLELLEHLTVRVDEMSKQMSEAKGGWRVLMLIGGACATAGSGLTWVLQHLKAAP